MKPCKSERNWLNYISKGDEEPYFNVAVDKLSFNYMALFWARNTEKFSSVMRLWIYCDNTNAVRFH